jgi:outer membrane protein W
LEAVASEALSGTVWFEMNSQWGNNASGSLGADRNIVVVKGAWLDWTPPNTDLKIRMGIQPLAMPSFTGAASVFDDDVAAVTFNYKFNDNVSLTALWARPYNDNGGLVAGDRGHNQYYMDNVDVGALLLPLSFDGVKVTPWVMLGAIGPNFNHNPDTFSGSTYGRVVEGMLPVGGAIRKDGMPSGKPQHGYATAFWAGLTGEVTAFDPFRLAWDVNYGSATWPDDGRLNRAGWLASLLFEYKLDWGIPGLYGWYGSGDDSDPSNGSERMAVFDFNGTNQFSHFAFNGSPTINTPREGVISTNMAGTWGVGIRLKDFSFVEDLKHTLRVNYIGGTNSPDFARKYLTGQGRGYTSITRGGFNNTAAGLNNMYLTKLDSAVEFGLRTDYKVYENLNIYLDANYLLMSINEDVWKGASFNGGTGDDKRTVRDPWNLQLGFVYSF